MRIGRDGPRKILFRDQNSSGGQWFSKEFFFGGQNVALAASSPAYFFCSLRSQESYNIKNFGLFTKESKNIFNVLNNPRLNVFIEN